MKKILTLAILAGCLAAAKASPPVILTAPQSITINAGSTAEFEVSASNAVGFQWMIGGTNIPGETNAYFVFDDVSTNQAGVYSVVVSSSDTPVTNSATLTVLQGSIVNFTISGFASGPSNVVVELFDHDKPATTENFVHYIRSGAYSNMFFDRLIPGFVLQGGDYDAQDQTNTTPGLEVFDIYNTYVQNSAFTPPLPLDIQNEFSVGPFVSNVKGTLALALPSNNTNGGNSAFFFNLVDNTFLDNEQFTVFGRVIGGQSILDYFNDTNNFSKPPTNEWPANNIFTNNIFTNGIFDDVVFNPNATTFTDVPVNFDGTNVPANVNLFFVAFSFPVASAQPVVDTNPPTETVSVPSANELLTNGLPFTALGTASDNVAVARVLVSLAPLNGANGGNPIQSDAIGTTNWSATFTGVEPGIYNFTATAQDGAGNLGNPATISNVIITAVITNGEGAVTVTDPVTGNVTNAIGEALITGTNYTLGEQPGPGWLFVNWSGGVPTTLSTNLAFQMSDNLVVAANFISNDFPGAIAFTYPLNEDHLLTNNFSLQGQITGDTNAPVSITCQIYSYPALQAVGSVFQTAVTNAWSLAVTNLVPGKYAVQAIAQDTNGYTTLITEDFYVASSTNAPVVTSAPQNITVNAGSTAEFDVSATNAFIYQWMVGGTNIPGATNSFFSFDNVSTNQAGVYSVVVSSYYSSVTNSATLTVVQGSIVNFTISGFASGPTNVVVELFDHDKPATTENFVRYIRSGAYSNMFFDRLISGFILQGGDFDAQDRTNTAPGLNVYNIYDTYVQNFYFTPPLPLDVQSEFSVGPFVSNAKGTLALALPSGNPNGGNSAFFFNLVDNSSLDFQHFTVFGRVIGGQNVLDFFNNTNNFFEPPTAPYTNGIFNFQEVDPSEQSFTNLPVNFRGPNVPADINLFFVDFSFPDLNAQPVIDTNPPTETVTFPLANQILTNGYSLTASGTASDNVAVARVVVSMLPLNGANGGNTIQSDASGTTNWSYSFGVLQPGIYNFNATAQDGAGNIGNEDTQTNIVITAVVTNGFGAVTLTNLANSATANAVGANMLSGIYYALGAQPGPGQLFLNWSGSVPQTLNPNITFLMTNDLVVTATFISNNFPGAIAITFPANGAQLNSGDFSLQGVVTGDTNVPVSITAQIYSYTVQEAVGPPLQTAATNGWSVPVTDLAPGRYYAQVLARDAGGNTTLIVNNFTVAASAAHAPVAVVTYPLSRALLANGLTLIAQGTASASAGLSNIICTLVPLGGGSSAIPFGGNAVGTTNWSFNFGVVNQGTYNLVVTPQDATGNFGNSVVQSNILVSAVLTNGDGFVSAIDVTTRPALGSVIPRAVGVFLNPGDRYTLTAHPGPRLIFVNWSGDGSATMNPNFTFTMSENTAVTANFVSNTVPGGLSFTYPLPGEMITNGDFIIQGRLRGLTNTPVNITCQVYSFSSQSAVGPPLTTSTSTTTWAVAETNNLAPGRYFLQAVAQDSEGHSALLLNIFTVLTKLTVVNVGGGVIEPNLDGRYLVDGQEYAMKAANGNGTVFYSWSDGVNTSLNSLEMFTMAPGLTLTATFLSNSSPNAISFTSPPANAQLTNGLVTLAGRINSSVTVTQITTQIFVNSNAITPLNTASITNSTNWAATPTNLAPGHYVVEAASRDAQGGSAVISESFDVLASLRLQITNGLGVLSSNWHGGYLLVGTPLQITATPGANYLFGFWSGGASGSADPLNVVLTNNETIVANFASNYFPSLSGTYNGLFYPTSGSITPTNSGYYTLTVNSSGVFSGSLNFPSTDVPFAGALAYDGSALVWGHGLGNQLMTNVIYLDLTNGTESVGGYVANAGFVADLTAFRAVTQLAANSVTVPGQYVLSIPGDHAATNNHPGGDGYGTFSVSAGGVLNLSGVLADDTAISESTTLSKDGYWPIYASLYNGNGLILGWQTNAWATNQGGLLLWVKPPKSGVYYTNGFDFLSTTVSTNLTLPAANTRYQISLGGGTLSPGITNSLTVNASGQFVPDTGQTNQLVISITRSTGAVSGQFLAAPGRTLSFSGVFLSPSEGGSGFILDSDAETGYFTITAAP